MRSRRTSAPSVRGYTLVELAITVAIVAILATIALPSFARVIASNRIAAGVNDFIAAVNLARGEAIRRGGEAGVCPSANGTTCGTDWDAGYLVYTGASATPVPVRVGSFSTSNTMTGTLTNISFNGRGLAASSGQLSYKPENAAHEELQRCLFISLSGSVTSKSGSC